MNLPTGTVTFLFTDIENSTRLWEEQPDSMRLALKRHNALIAEAVESAGGHVFKTLGDAFCACFARADKVVAAAAAAQRLLQSEPWPDGVGLRGNRRGMGRAMTLEQAIEYGLSGEEPS